MEKNPACRLARRSGTCLRTHLQSWEILEERMGGFSLFYLIICLWTSGLIFPLWFSGVEEPWPTCVTRFMGNVQQRPNGQQGSVLSLWFRGVCWLLSLISLCLSQTINRNTPDVTFCLDPKKHFQATTSSCSAHSSIPLLKLSSYIPLKRKLGH